MLKHSFIDSRESVNDDNMKNLIIVSLFLTLVGAGCGRVQSSDYPAAAPEPAAPREQVKQPMPAQPAMSIDKTKTYTAILNTDAGKITIALNAAETPITVNNFVSLARQNFYDGTPFHRTISGFMIQGGDPKGNGTGGPGYRFDDEPFTGSYSRGTVAMANAGPKTNGSQYFIMHADYPLPPNYVIFGHVTSGMDVVDAIATAPVLQSVNGERSKPITPVVVQSVEIVEE